MKSRNDSRPDSGEIACWPRLVVRLGARAIRRPAGRLAPPADMIGELAEYLQPRRLRGMRVLYASATATTCMILMISCRSIFVCWHQRRLAAPLIPHCMIMLMESRLLISSEKKIWELVSLFSPEGGADMHISTSKSNCRRMRTGLYE